MPSFALVFFAEILHGLTAGIVTPAIAAISLGLVGRRAMSVRTGRNYRFNAAGNALTAGLMGLAGQYFTKSAIFFGAAALCIPALIALSRKRRKSGGKRNRDERQEQDDTCRQFSASRYTGP
jgi:MFS family permease